MEKIGTEKIRLDKLLVSRGLAPAIKEAQALILAKAVKVNDVTQDKADMLVPGDAEIHLKGENNPYVSRGGLKLKGALEEFQLDVTDIVALDVGASTGGFTDCLLQAGARKVYALDVGYGQLAWKLRKDKRVVVIERTNIRYYDGSHLNELLDLVTIDVSFISLKIVLPVVLKLLANGGQILALIKPQFEAEREEIGKNGLIENPSVQERVVLGIIDFCRKLDLQVEGTCVSPLLGPVGNKEFFVLTRKNN